MNVEFRHLRPSFSLLECSHTVFRISAAIDATISHFLSWMTFRDQGSNELISNMFYRFLFDYFSSCESLGTMMPRLHSSCPGCTQQKRRSSPSQSIKVTGLATRPGPGSKFNFNDPSRGSGPGSSGPAPRSGAPRSDAETEVRLLPRPRSNNRLARALLMQPQ